MLRPRSLLLLVAAFLLSTKTIAQSGRAADSVRVVSLMDSAFAYRATDLPQSLEFLQIALEVAEEAELKEFVGSANNRSTICSVGTINR